MAGETGNKRREMSVTITVDELGNLRTTASPGMNKIEVLCMLQLAHEGCHSQAVEKGKVVIPPNGSPFSVIRND